MIVDASALLAILLREPEMEAFRDIIATTSDPTMSPVNFIEAAICADALGSAVGNGLDAIMAAGGISVTQVTPEQAHLAREAYRRFGKGNHAAKLNLGDCFACALSKARGEPLLFKGDDFRLTDVEAAI